MKKLVSLFLFLPVSSFAALPVLKYSEVTCRLSVDEKVVKETTASLMTLVIEESLGRFAQIQFGDDTKKIQYQILIENSEKQKDAVNVLQNLMVGDAESSVEFSALTPNWVRVGHGNHSVACDLKQVD
ncbi:hypothetical protein [Bdellovibrio reynosensis]|uniref:Uncharacterized protein n=1 Tax=Bdellovibrio reynosensis TaxID=2835041 RepID=A0ABY4CD23_9BACT|nr:hypothetical protein [Bdellovibrio reynosensis]UOF02871.1 hypothetical protein MNR06_07880 [Bdellovibrio reynosensis]